MRLLFVFFFALAFSSVYSLPVQNQQQSQNSVELPNQQQSQSSVEPPKTTEASSSTSSSTSSTASSTVSTTVSITTTTHAPSTEKTSTIKSTTTEKTSTIKTTTTAKPATKETSSTAKSGLFEIVFTDTKGKIFIVIIAAIILVLLSISSGVVHVVLTKCCCTLEKGISSTTTTNGTIQSASPMLTRVVVKAKTSKPQAPIVFKEKVTKKKSKGKKEKKKTDKKAGKKSTATEISELSNSNSAKKNSEPANASALPTKQSTKAPLAAHDTQLEEFMYQGPLIIRKDQRLLTENELKDEEKSEGKGGSGEHFKFKSKSNKVYDMGSDVEIVKSSSTKQKRTKDAFTTTKTEEDVAKMKRQYKLQQGRNKELNTPKTPKESKQLDTSTFEAELKEEGSVLEAVDSSKRAFDGLL